MNDVATLAQHYVLGLLDADARAEVEARIASPQDPDDTLLADEIRAAAETWAEVDLTAPEVAMSDGAWAAIERALNGQAAGAGSDTSPASGPDSAPNVVPFARPAPQSEAAARGSVRLWRSIAAVAVAVSVGLGGLVLTGALTPSPVVMAILLDDNGNSVAVIEAFGDDSVRVTPLMPVASGEAKVFEVWTKPDPDGPPVSLGVLERAVRARLAGPDLPRPAEDQLFEITLEPEGGSPTGLPTGPIIGKGLAQQTF